MFLPDWVICNPWLGSTSCSDGTNAYNVWITNVVATLVSGTNATMILQLSRLKAVPTMFLTMFSPILLSDFHQHELCVGRGKVRAINAKSTC